MRVLELKGVPDGSGQVGTQQATLEHAPQRLALEDTEGRLHAACQPGAELNEDQLEVESRGNGRQKSQPQAGFEREHRSLWLRLGALLRGHALSMAVAWKGARQRICAYAQ